MRPEGSIEMDFPSEAPSESPELLETLEEIVGASLTYSGKNRIDCLAEVKDVETLRNIKPNLSKLSELDFRGLIVTAQSEDDYDFKCRTFYPKYGDS